MYKATINSKRRVFLSAAVSIPAIAVVTLLTRQKAVTTASLPEARSIPAGTGYHETEHIRKYYRSAAYL